MTTLLVPVYLDALYLPTKTDVLGEMTDYSKLPYYKGLFVTCYGSIGGINRLNPYLAKDLID